MTLCKPYFIVPRGTRANMFADAGALGRCQRLDSVSRKAALVIDGPALHAAAERTKTARAEVSRQLLVGWSLLNPFL